MLSLTLRASLSRVSQPVMALIFHSDPFCCNEASRGTKHASQGQRRCPVSVHLHSKLHYSVAPIRFILQIVFPCGKETVKHVDKSCRPKLTFILLLQNCSITCLAPLICGGSSSSFATYASGCIFWLSIPAITGVASPRANLGTY